MYKLLHERIAAAHTDPPGRHQSIQNGIHRVPGVGVTAVIDIRI